MATTSLVLAQPKMVAASLLKPVPTKQMPIPHPEAAVQDATRALVIVGTAGVLLAMTALGKSLGYL